VVTIPPASPHKEVAASLALPSERVLPKKEDLEREQLYLTNQKLKRDAEPERWWLKLVRNVVAVGGVVTLAATVFGIWDSYNKTIVDRERTRTADQRARFEDAIKRLESSSTISKLVGVSVLSGYLGASNKELHRQVLFTLAGLMAAEKDSQTQAAVINLMDSIPRDGPIAPTDWRYFQDMLVTQSRALMAKGDLSRHRYFRFSQSPFMADELAARTVGKLIAINARKGAVPDYANYRGIYCADCDFQGVVFPRGVDFTGAVLDRANFSRARLEASLFDNAAVVATKFVEADLRGAHFRSLDMSVNSAASGEGNDRVPFGRTAYLDFIAYALNVNANVDMRMPNFSCANLEGATFHYHALFPGVMTARRSYVNSAKDKPRWHQDLDQDLKERAFQPALAAPPKFLKANIKEAHFEKARFFAFSEYPNSSIYMKSATRTIIEELNFYQGDMTDNAFQIEAENNNSSVKRREDNARTNVKDLDRDLLLFQQRMRAAFYLVELDHASLPENMANFLKRSIPTLGDFQSVFRTPGSSALDQDLECTPRRN
jgi:uncharacterized protein YjbI with pentapeptide repeats